MKKINKKLQWWLNEYSKSHQNSANKMIHYFCVPAIAISLSGLLMCIPIPDYIPKNLNYCSIAMLLSLFFYCSISLRHMSYMGVFFIFCYLLNWSFVELLTQAVVLYSYTLVFVIAWIAQFVGHIIEGKRPSFLLDIQFLLIGPLWILDRIMDRRND